MEIVDLVRSARRLGWLVVILPVLTAVLSLAYQFTQPPQYTASVLVNLPADATGRTAAQFGRDFSALLSTDQVVDAIATSTKLQPSAVRAGLSAQPQQEGSTVVRVSWKGTDPHPDRLALAAARSTYSLLTQPYLITLTGVEKAGSDEQVRTQKAMKDFVKAHGGTDPGTVLTVARAALAQAKAGIDEATTDVRKKAANDQVSRTQKEFDTAQQIANDFAPIEIAAASADERLFTIRKNIADAQAALKAAKGSGIVAGPVHRVAPNQARLRAAAGGGIVGLLAAIVMLAALQSISGSRRTRRRPNSSATGPGSGARAPLPAANRGAPPGRNGSSPRSRQHQGSGRPIPDDMDSLPRIFGGEQRSGRR